AHTHGFLTGWAGPDVVAPTHESAASGSHRSGARRRASAAWSARPLAGTNLERCGRLGGQPRRRALGPAVVVGEAMVGQRARRRVRRRARKKLSATLAAWIGSSFRRQPALLWACCWERRPFSV